MIGTVIPTNSLNIQNLIINNKIIYIIIIQAIKTLNENIKFPGNKKCTLHTLYTKSIV